MAKTFAPIALFVYNRLTHTQKTILSLLDNSEAAFSDLFIFSDGAKKQEDVSTVDELRSYLKTISGFKSVSIIERTTNWGLSKSIIAGVTDIVSKHGSVVVMEDDIVTSNYFLKFMNDGLEKFRSNQVVASIHGYVYPTPNPLPELFFLKGADCWGWATWKRAWDLFEEDGSYLLSELKERKLIDSFDFDGAYGYSKMLSDQVKGLNQSWAVRWHASCFLRDMVTLYPGTSLVQNIGLDNSGTHCEETTEYHSNLSDKPIEDLSIAIEENGEAREAFKAFFSLNKSNNAQPKKTFHRRAIGKLKRVCQELFPNYSASK